jgi:hypothetical protein
MRSRRVSRLSRRCAPAAHAAAPTALAPTAPLPRTWHCSTNWKHPAAKSRSEASPCPLTRTVDRALAPPHQPHALSYAAEPVPTAAVQVPRHRHASAGSTLPHTCRSSSRSRRTHSAPPSARRSGASAARLGAGAPPPQHGSADPAQAGVANAPVGMGPSPATASLALPFPR